jgi:hypothetical protein
MREGSSANKDGEIPTRIPTKKHAARAKGSGRGDFKDANAPVPLDKDRKGAAAGSDAGWRTPSMIRSASPAGAWIGVPARARLISLASSRSPRAWSEEPSKTAAACCSGAGQVDISSPSRSSRSSNSVIFIKGNICSDHATALCLPKKQAPVFRHDSMPMEKLHTIFAYKQRWKTFKARNARP